MTTATLLPSPPPAPALQSAVLKRWLQHRPGGYTQALQRAGLLTASPRDPQRRHYAAATTSRLTDGWTTTSLSSTASLLGQLDVLRARARQLHKDNDYAKKYQQLVAGNIVGPQGFRFEARIYQDDGLTPDTLANNAVEAAWQRWSRRGSCEVGQRLSLRDTCHVIIKAAERDGEYLVRYVLGAAAGNPFGIALQVLDVNRIDTQLNRSAQEGVNAILMGIEVDTYLRPVAYHLRPTMSGDVYHLARTPAPAQRIPADEILHGFITDTPEQVRGVPWMHAAMLRLQNLGGYEEAAIIASRVGASQMGFFTTPDGQPQHLADDQQPSVDGQAPGDFVMDAAPGEFRSLPEGMQFQPFNPAYPAAMFGDFVKANLRGIASGLGVAYHALANDLQGVSYSSIRRGTLEERDAWMVLQSWFIDAFLEPLFDRWLTFALANGQVLLPNGSALPLSRRAKFSAHAFAGRRWSWVDPLKDVQADIAAMQAGLRSPQDVAAGMGKDLEDTLLQIQAANTLAERLGVRIATQAPAAVEGPDETDEPLAD
ncbi:MAG: phage portal protein [Inhella sp.]